MLYKILLSVIIGIVFHSIYFLSKRYLRYRTFRDWQVYDRIIVNESVMKKQKISYKNGRTMAKLHAWSYTNIYLSFGCDNVYRLKWDIYELNKSAFWRRKYNECLKVMGDSPRFSTIFSDEVLDKVEPDEKTIERLSETECQVYLKKAIDSENYELAELLKKQLEKYRK